MRRVRFLLGILGLSVIAILAGCSGATEITREDRVSDFMSDISQAGDFNSVGENIHPDASQYQQVQAASYWNASFALETTYTLSGLSISGDVGTATFNGGTYNDVDIEFTFKNDPEDAGGLFGGESDNYKIIGLELDGSTIVQ